MLHPGWIGLLAALLPGCGARTEILDDAVNDVGGGTGSTAGGASVGGASAMGGGGSIDATGGFGGTEDCLGVKVTFQAVSSFGAQWCLGRPGQCANGGSDIRGVSDASGTLFLSALCSTNCQTCTMNDCHSLLCAPPTEVKDTATIYEWDGTYYEYGTTNCGSRTTTCASLKCAKPGMYEFEFFAFPNPAPGTANGCSLATSATPVSNFAGTFVYPTDTYVSFGL
jgi:hypothetical protein